MSNGFHRHWLPEPYCRPQLPWTMDFRTMLLGKVLLPLPSKHPEVKPTLVHAYPESFNPLVQSHGEILADPLEFRDVVNIADHWFSKYSSEPQVAGGMVMATRVLSVLSYLTDPREDRGDLAYDFWRYVLGFTPVPGGNLCTLMWLGYRYVRAFAIELRTLDGRLANASSERQFDSLVDEALSNAALIPGHDLARARDPRMSDRELNLWPHSGLEQAVKRALLRLERAVTQARLGTFSETRTRIYPIRSPDVRRIAPSPSHLSSSQILSRNFRSYVDSATDILGTLVDLLRLSGHVAVQLRRYVAPVDPSLGVEPGSPAPASVARRLGGWRRFAEPLSPLADLPRDLLDTHFEESWRDTTLPIGLILRCENQLVHRWNQQAWVATALAWGVLPGDVDSVHCAGRCKPESAQQLDPQKEYRQPPSYDVGDYDPSDLQAGGKGSPIAARLRSLLAESQERQSRE